MAIVSGSMPVRFGPLWIAIDARQCQVRLVVRSPVLDRDDVLDLVADEWLILLPHVAAFAPFARPSADMLAGGGSDHDSGPR